LQETFTSQCTIRREVAGEGIGLHSGAPVLLRLKPAPVDFGIRFRRMDLPGNPMVTAHYRNVTETALATTIGCNGVTVSTIEHLMAALMGRGVDNALVELDGPEVPIFDGSARFFVEMLQRAGLEEQNGARRFVKIRRELSFREGDAFIRAVPGSDFRLRYTIDFPHPLIGRQELRWSFAPGDFARDIAAARTFGFLKDVQKLQSVGLALGGSLSNAVVFDDRTLLNGEGLRYGDECVRHKVLDFLGDVALVGMPLLGHFEIHKAGHTLHNRFLRRLMGSPSCYAAEVPRAFTVPFFQTPSFSALAEPIPLASKSS